MKPFTLGEMEQKFADLIWEHQPVPTRELTGLCAEKFEWKRTTTYTMLKRLCDRRIFENRNGMVVSLMSREEFLAAQSEQFVKETFNGSLPLFLAAFTRRKHLSKQEIREIERLIKQHREE